MRSGMERVIKKCKTTKSFLNHFLKMSFHNTIVPRQLQTSFLKASSQLYESACPNLARSLISKLHDSTTKQDAARQHCIHCHSPLQPGLCRVKLSPRPRITREIEHLKRRLANPREGSLTSAQRKKVKRWMNSKNVLVICCNFCKKTNRIPCAKRSDRQQSLESYASQSTSFQDSTSRKRKRKSTSNDSFSKLATSSTAGNFVSPPSKKQKRQSSSSNLSASSTPRRTVHGGDVKPSPSGRSSRSAKKDKYRQLQTMLKSAKREQQSNIESPLSKFLTSL